MIVSYEKMFTELNVSMDIEDTIIIQCRKSKNKLIVKYVNGKYKIEESK